MCILSVDNEEGTRAMPLERIEQKKAKVMLLYILDGLASCKTSLHVLTYGTHIVQTS